MLPWTCLSLLFGIAPAIWGQTALQMPPARTLPATPLPPLPHPTLDRIHAANALTCGVAKEEEDYSRAEDHGNRAAFDIDLCEAVAVATLGPGARLVVKSYPDEPSALRALRGGAVDLLATASLSVSNMAQNIAFSAPVLLDGQGFLVPNKARAHSPADLAGKKVCFLTGSSAEEGLHAYAAAHGISFVWYPFSEAGEMEAAFFTGNCDAVSSDQTQLANIRAIEATRAPEFSILPDTIRQDPLAMATWAGDPQFAAVVFWTADLLLAAEQAGITRGNVGAVRAGNDDTATQQMLGQRFGTGERLGLRFDWASSVLAAVGNYGEIFERDLGQRSRLRLARGQNRLASEGGGLFPVPVGKR